MPTSYKLNSYSYEGRHFELSCTQIKDIENSKSTIKWTLTMTGGSANYYSCGPTEVKINGVTIYSKARTDYTTYKFPAARGSVSGSLTVTHNADGTKSVPISIKTAIYEAATHTTSGTWTLDTLPVKAVITSAPNFDSATNNPKIEYNNYLGNKVTSLKACIALVQGGGNTTPWVDIPLTGNSYEFSLSQSDMNTLIAAVPSNKRDITLYFYIQTVYNGATYYHNVAKKFTLVNSNPTFTCTIVDSNATTKALTHNQNILIKYKSLASVVVSATPGQGATISKVKVTNSGRTYEGASLTIGDITSGDFEITVTDSRGFETSQTISKTLVDYIIPNISVKTNSISPATGQVQFNLEGTVFDGYFGPRLTSEQNDYDVYLVYQDTTEEEAHLIHLITVTVTEGKFNFNFTYSFDYTKQYYFSGMITDSLNTSGILSSQQKLQFQPTYYWNNEEFNFMVPVNMPIAEVVNPETGHTWSTSPSINFKTEDGLRYNLDCSLGADMLEVFIKDNDSGLIPFSYSPLGNTDDGGVLQLGASGQNVNTKINIIGTMQDYNTWDGLPINVLDSLFYKPNEEVTLYYDGGGYVTTSSTQMNFIIPLGKSTARIHTITIQSGASSFTMQARQNGNYIVGTGSSSESINQSPYTTNLSIKNNCLAVQLKKSSAFSTNTQNNSAVGIHAELKVKFN